MIKFGLALLMASLGGCANGIFVAPAPSSVIMAKDRSYVFDPIPEPPMMLMNIPRTKTQQEKTMQFLIGAIFGIVLATIGAHGVANYVDHGVDLIKKEAVQLNKKI